MLAQSLRRCTSPASVAASAVRSVPEATRQAVVVVLNQSQGGMCICRGLALGLGFPQKSFGP